MGHIGHAMSATTDSATDKRAKTGERVLAALTEATIP